MSSSRLHVDQLFMLQAVLMAERGTCKRAKVGAIIARDNRAISSGYVGSPSGEPHCIDVGCLMKDGHCTRTTHAEANAIAYAARSGTQLHGAILYTTLAPCRACQLLMLSAGIHFCYYLRPNLHDDWERVSLSLPVQQIEVAHHSHPFIAWGSNECLICGDESWSHS